MQLWPVLVWPKPKARHHTQQHHGNRKINFQFTTRTFSPPAEAAKLTTTFLYKFVIIAMLLITSAWGLAVSPQPTANYEGVNTVADVNVLSALTGLSNDYATSNYMKNYYQASEAEASKQQQQHQNTMVATAVYSGRQGEMGGAGVTGSGFVGLHANTYGNSNSARGSLVGVGGVENGFSAYNGGFVPTSFTTAGQHYAASLTGLQNVTDKSNTLHQYAINTANKNNLHANHQPYVNVNSNNNAYIVAEDDNTKAHHSLFKRLSNYGGLSNADGEFVGDGDGDTETGSANLDVVDDDGGVGTAAAAATASAADTAELMHNYALTYADDAQQSSMLQNFYNQHTTFNDAQSVPEQTFENYFPPATAATAEYELENQQKYYTLNNYQQTTQPPSYQQFEQQTFAQYHKQQPYQLRKQEEKFNQLEVHTATLAPETYYQTYIQHKNDNEGHRQQHRHIAADNYHKWKQNQIMANYQPKQSAIVKQHKQLQQQQSQQNNQHHQQHLLQEPEPAETSLSARIKKSPKHKSKRHDNHHDYGHNYSSDTLLEQNDNTIEYDTNAFSSLQFQQLERLQEQLQQQQQQFIELQHQLIDHDQQLQIQKHVSNNPQPPLPPITQTVHHSPQSLQALAGKPLSTHTQIIRNIPVPQHQRVHVPFRENVTIEIPDPVITPIKTPLPIQIPITKTVTVPKIQEVKIPIEKVRPFPVERPIPYIVERRVPYTVEKQVAQPVYYPVPIKVPILHTVIHKLHKPHGPQHRHQSSFHLPHTVYHRSQGHGYGYGHGHGHGHSNY